MPSTIDLYKTNPMYTVLVGNNHEDWLVLREAGIGGSEVSSIIGVNPYCTNQQLWRYKVGFDRREDISDKPYVKYGSQAEQYIRALFQLDYPQFDVQYKENVVLSNNSYPFIRYSPDGLIYDMETGMKGIFECKTTTIVQSMSKEKWDHQIPQNYYCQILQGLLVTGFDFVILRAQLNYGNCTVDSKHTESRPGYKAIRDYLFYRDDPQVSQDIQLILNQEYAFYTVNIKRMIEPDLILPTPTHTLA